MWCPSSHLKAPEGKSRILQNLGEYGYAHARLSIE
ncbi:hypothetical protein HMPREF0018_00525 [Acinetobacter radioresistens SH164]|nr:hypothetical protein HMPREF0018_00525 [Acinetobacter radioresistens SH164]